MGRFARIALVAVLLLSTTASIAALRRTSTTFDEIVLVAAGARALETGSWSMVVDQPPLMPLLYGAAALSGAPHVPEGGDLGYDDRWNYARAFFFDAGNDPRQLAFRSRLVGVACLVALVVSVFLITARAAGEPAALAAATLVAFLPDVLAHAGVAYNDLPLALAYFFGVVALDAFVRRPGVTRGAVAGVAVAAALAVKFSAVALLPVAVFLAAAEVMAGRPERRWWGALALGAGVGVLAAWALSALLYGGDPTLLRLRLGYWMTVLHARQGHPAPAYLLGATSASGWWWFFPVAFLLKTPVAFQLLLAVAGGAAAPVLVRSRGRALLPSPLRAPLIGALVFGAFLLASNLNAGFRYALPVLPLLAILAGAGVARVWRGGGARLRVALALLLALHVGSALSVHPWYLSYLSEWGRARRSADPPLLDSSFDWGQGLLALREWMDSEGVERVDLSYFGSALPSGYGIRYRALPSFLSLPDDPFPARAGLAPGWTAISATNVRGLYFGATDSFAAYRGRAPDAVVGGSILLYREEGG